MLMGYKQTNIRSTANLRGQGGSRRYVAAMAESLSVTARRIIARMDELNMTQADLAEAVAITQSAISQILNGKTANSRHLPRIAEELSVNLGWLRGATDEKIEMLDIDGNPISEEAALAGLIRREQSRRDNVADRRRSFRGGMGSPLAELGLVAIKEIDLALGAGGAYVDDGAVMEVERYFPEQWLREFTDAPINMLAFARVRGTSMKPTIDHGAIVMIDLRRRRIDEQDEIWAVGVAEIGMVKRIWANPDGSYKIKSDNPAVNPEMAVDDEMFVIGRVIGGLSKF